MDGSLHPTGGAHRQPRFHTRLRRGMLLLALVLASLAVLPTANASAATVPSGMLGMNDWETPSDQMLGTISRVGVKRWRVPLFWYLVEKQQGQRDWSQFDRIVSSSTRNGVGVLFVLVGCPAFACSELSGPPTSSSGLTAQRAFLRAAVARYGTGGSFWREHPELPARPVTDWQIWNEVNAREFWKPGPNAADYARFLRDSAAVVRQTDPRAKIVLAGLTEFGQIPVADFLRQLYRQPGFKASVDVIGIHAYEANTARVGQLLDRTRAVMTANRDHRPIWITEMGWGTSSPQLKLYSQTEQAELMRSSFDMLIGCRARWNLGRAYWFAYNDFEIPAGQPDAPGYHTGLFDLAGRPKQAWNTLQGFREGAQRPQAGCGAGSQATRSGAPQTRVKIKRRLRKTRRARAKLAASKRGVRFECKLSRSRKRGAKRGRKAARKPGRWRKCSKRYRSPKLRVGYRYTLLVRARDAQGRADASPARVKLRLKKTRRGRLIIRAARRR